MFEKNKYGIEKLMRKRKKNIRDQNGKWAGSIGAHTHTNENKIKILVHQTQKFIHYWLDPLQNDVVVVVYVCVFGLETIPTNRTYNRILFELCI